MILKKNFLKHFSSMYEIFGFQKFDMIFLKFNIKKFE